MGKGQSSKDGKRVGDATRAERLEQALRDNLRRRKAQAKARETARTEPQSDDGKEA